MNHSGDDSSLPFGIQEKLKAAVKSLDWNNVEVLIFKHTQDYPFHLRITALRTAIGIAHLDDSQLKVFCSDKDSDFIDALLTIAAKCTDDALVCHLLDQGVTSTEKYKWVIKTFQEKTGQKVQLIQCHCPTDQVNSILTYFVKNQLWEYAKRVLKRKDISETLRRWALEEASRSPNYFYEISELCPHERTEQILHELVKQHNWSCAVDILKKKASETQLRWVIEKAALFGDASAIRVFQLVPKDMLDGVTKQLLSRHMWSCLDHMLKQEISKETHTLVLEQAAIHAKHEDRYELGIDKNGKLKSERKRKSDFENYILPHCADSEVDFVLDKLIERKRWTTGVIPLLQREGGVSDSNYLTALKEACSQLDEHADLLAQLVTIPPRDRMFKILLSSLQQRLSTVAMVIMTRVLLWDKRLAECLSSVVTESEHYTNSQLSHPEQSPTLTDKLPSPEYQEVINCTTAQDMCDNDEVNLKAQTAILEGWTDHLTKDRSLTDNVDDISGIDVLSRFLTQYHSQRKTVINDKLLFKILALVPLFLDVQNTALKILLREERWDVIVHASLTHVWEQTRRDMFQAAVEQEQWGVVKGWADHTLYDDQRGFALREAFKHKQWDVLLLLADHGLTKTELMGVHYRLARFGDWDSVLHMFERGADVNEVLELLQFRMRKEQMSRYADQAAIAVMKKKHSDVIALRNLTKSFRGSLCKAAKQNKLREMLYQMHREPSKKTVKLVLKMAISKSIWSVVCHLVKEHLSGKHWNRQRDRLFSKMIQKQQWGVCRALLEEGVSVQLCIETLPYFIKIRQWLLVARVMEYRAVEDETRLQVQWTALDKKEGSVFWHCIRTMQRVDPEDSQNHFLSLEKRKSIFRQALRQGVWQAVKPMVEYRDPEGIQHRDTAFTIAIKERRWDVVDFCEKYYSDVNDEDDNKGETRLHEAAGKDDWAAVEELVKRDSDQGRLDREGSSVLHRAIEAGQWDTVHMLVQYQGDVNLSNRRELYPFGSRYRKGETPLMMLVSKYRADIIMETLMWGCGVKEGVDLWGRTPLRSVQLVSWAPCST